MVSVEGLKVEFGAKPLFSDVTFVIGEKERVALVGKNGAGKSTLLKILAGLQQPTAGTVGITHDSLVGYLPQVMKLSDSCTVMEEAEKAFSNIAALKSRIAKLNNELAERTDYDSPEYMALVEKFSHESERYNMMGGDNYHAVTERTLTGLGFERSDFERPTSEFSGGWRMRIELAKILLRQPDVLLLDEPTNHLDISAIAWLEDFLKNFNGACLIISHDRYFLDRVTNKTFELENGRFRSYNGNYSAYMAQREIDKKTEQRNYDNTMREIQRLENVVEQQRRWGREKNIKTAESKMKVIERLEKDLNAPMQSPEEMEFTFKACAGGGQDVVQTESLGMAFDNNRLFSNVDMLIKKGEKVFLLGPNGCGKTTLLKILMGDYEQTEGSYKIGANIHIGYYDQIQENLNMDKTVIDEVWDEYPNLTQTQIRNALAVFLFKGEDVFKEIHKLSGGERARVELVKLMLKSVNLLIMDEPTNHLDIESREALENALSDYDGTMIMVSHDRYFINKLADRILYLTPNGVESYSGDYDSFVARETVKTEQKTESAGHLDYKEQKRLEAEKRKTLNRFAKVEDEISNKESEVEELSKELENSDIATDYVKAGEITDKITELQDKIESLMEEWERLQMIIEESGYDV